MNNTGDESNWLSSLELGARRKFQDGLQVVRLRAAAHEPLARHRCSRFQQQDKTNHSTEGVGR